MRSRKAVLLSLVAGLVLLPAVVPAQEMMVEEQPEVGFRSLGPRTVVSFVRQTVPEPDTAEAPVREHRWNTLLHLTNTGNGPIAAVAVFVPSDGRDPSAQRLGGIAPGQTQTVSVAGILGDVAAPGESVTGVVFVRFFAPVLDDDRDLMEGENRLFYSQMVSAETIFEFPDLPPQIIRLDVERPQVLAPVRRHRR